MSDEQKLQELDQRYRAAAHAMQTGVLLRMQREGARFADDTHETAPKHLRVGINSAMVDTGAMAMLLIRKGIITELEYREVLVEMMEREAESYRKGLPDGVHLA